MGQRKSRDIFQKLFNSQHVHEKCSQHHNHQGNASQSHNDASPHVC